MAEELHLEYIVWRDASFVERNQERREVRKGVVQAAVGWCVDECDDFVHLAQECSPTIDDWWRHVKNIPKVNILERKRIPLKYTKGLLSKYEKTD